MTDNEIVKALKVCHITCGCSECPYEKAPDDCVEIMKRDALDLINRQKEQIESVIAGQETLQKYIAEKDAEIERLKDYPKCVYEYDGDITDYCLKSPCSNYKTADEIKSEAVKEFAEKVKGLFNPDIAYDISREIDNLVKEMVGDTE